MPRTVRSDIMIPVERPMNKMLVSITLLGLFAFGLAGCDDDDSAGAGDPDAEAPCIEQCEPCEPQSWSAQADCCDGLYCEPDYGGPFCEVQNRDEDPDLCADVDEFSGPCEPVGTLCSVGASQVVCFCDGWHILD